MQSLPTYILAGGKSSRFGSDKARAISRDQSLIQHVASMLQPIASQTWAIADKIRKYNDLNVQTIADQTPHLGPLGGLQTALAHRLAQYGPGWCITCSCDLLQVETTWFEQLWQYRQHDTLAIAFKNQFWEPLIALYHSDLLPTVNTQLEQNQLSLQQLLNLPAANTQAATLPANWPKRIQANRRDDLN